MKLHKKNPARFLIPVLAGFFVFWFSGRAHATVKVTDSGLQINGAPFIVKGAGYNPVPIGIDPETTPPYGDYFTYNYRNIYERDFPLLRQMGANTIRLPGWNNTADHGNFLDKAYNNGVSPLYVIITFPISPALYPDIVSPDERERIKADFRSMVTAYKSHPTVLMWSIGNGLNDPRMYGDALYELFTLINEMADEAHAEEGANYHPVLVPLADIDLINTVVAYEPTVPDIDLWGSNVYRGASFGALFADFRAVSAKPILITGFGIDAYNGKGGGEYEYTGTPYQATYAQSLWKEIETNGDVSVGGVIRSYSDGWWLGKYGAASTGCPDSDPSIHGICGYPSGYDPDEYANYEWLGVMRAVKNGTNPDIMEPRAVYATLQHLWGANVLSSLFASAEADWNEKNWEKAIAGYRKIIESSPDSPIAAQAHLRVGEYRSFTMNHMDAISEYENAVMKAPGKRAAWEAKIGMAALYHLMGDYRFAYDLFSEVLEETKDWDLVKLSTYRMKETARLLGGSYQVGFRDESKLKKCSGCHESSQFTRTTAQCGAKALAEVLKFIGKEAPLKDVAEGLGVKSGFVSMAEIKREAESLGVKPTGLKLTTLDGLKGSAMPLIAHFKANHYVVVTSIGEKTLEVIDPDIGRITFTKESFRKRWSGYTLAFGESEEPGFPVATDEELKGVRGGHHLHGNNLGGPEGSPSVLFDYGPSSISGNSCAMGMPSAMVNLANLNFLVRDTDVAYGSRGPAVFVMRTYNADDPEEGIFGRSWTSNYEVSLTEDIYGDVVIKREGGKEDYFTSNGNGTFTRPRWVYDTLTKNPDGTFDLLIKGSKITQQFNAQGRLGSIKDRNNSTATLQYDAGGKLVSVTDATGRILTFTYWPGGKVQYVTDQLNRRVSYYYDSNNNLVRTVDLDGNESAYAYNEYSYMTSVTTEKGTTLITNRYYNSTFGYILASITDPLGNKKAYDVGSLLYVTDANGNTTVYYVDSPYGETTEVTDPLGNKAVRGIDSFGNIKSITDPLNNTTGITYDANGNVTSITDPLTNDVSMTYMNDNLASFTDPLNNTYFYAYNGNSNLTSATDPLNGVVRLVYNPYGEPTTLTDQRTYSTAFGYDSSGNLASVTYPLNNADVYTHDTVGRVATRRDAKNNTVTFGYDGIDRLTSITYPGGSRKTFTYDCCGMTSATGPIGALSFTYDNANRLTGFTDVYGKTVSYAYDPAGNLTSVTYPDNKTVSYTYDSANRLTSVTDWLGNVTSYSYDAAGRPVMAARPDGSVSRHIYDNAGRLASTIDYTGAGAVVSSFDYTLNGAGNRTLSAYYQPLMSEPATGKTTYAYDKENRLTKINKNTPLTYDANGNLLSKKVSNNVVATYAWDYDNMLTGATISGASYTYAYDPLGQRVKRVAGGVETRYITAGGTVLAEMDANNNITAYYVYGLGLISKVTPSGSAYYYHYDNLGSTVAMTDSSGNIVNKYAYDPYGKVLSQVEGISNPFKYVGAFGVMDEGNGLLYMRARYYDPATGRFISKDPIGWAGGLNLYAYTGNNPVNYADPLGLFWGIPMGEGYGEESAQYWADLYNQTGNPAYAVLGSIASLWTPCTSAETAITLVGGYAVAPWASKTGSWLGKIAYHSAHSGGPHQYPHLQIMIRVGKHLTKHFRIP